MAIFKIVNEPYENPIDILHELNYIYAPKKCTYAGSYNLFPGTNETILYNQFLYVKHYFRKTTGKQLEHFILSFDNHCEEKEVPFTQFVKSTIWILSDLFPEYQTAYAFHSTPNIHVHMIMNSINMITGKHYHRNQTDFNTLMKDIAIILKYQNIALKGYSYVNENGRFRMKSNRNGWLYENKLPSYL